MIIVDVKKFKNLDAALKVYKNKLQKSKCNDELKKRQEYVKPSVKRRGVVLKARYVEKLKRDSDN